MTEPIIYNCHIHVLTRHHAPRHMLKLLFDDTRLGRWLGPRISNWLGTALSELAQYGWIPKVFVPLARWLARITDNDVWEREANFLSRGDQTAQFTIFKAIAAQYPRNTRFIVLPMDMTYTDLGDISLSIEEQHSELLELAETCGDKIIPFYATDPRHPNALQEAERQLTSGKFKGLKLYPNLGYPPHHPVLLEIYKICEAENLPVMAHCSGGGVWQFGLSEACRRKLGHPHNYIPILRDYPNLRICLAHFGGADQWHAHLAIRPTQAELDEMDCKGVDQKPSASTGLDLETPWVKLIGDMIRSEKYPNLYTDISYTAFSPHYGPLFFDFFDYLKVLLANEHLQSQVLFGSDYYMVERERLSEKEVSIALRSRLGEQFYFKIANENPRRYLEGKRKDQPNPRKRPAA